MPSGIDLVSGQNLKCSENGAITKDPGKITEKHNIKQYKIIQRVLDNILKIKRIDLEVKGKNKNILLERKTMKLLNRKQILENINTRNCWEKICNEGKKIGSAIEIKMAGYRMVTFYSAEDAAKIIGEIQYKS